MRITVTNPNTGEEKKITISDNFSELSEEKKQKTKNEIISKLNWKSKESIEFEKDIEQRQEQIDENQMPAAVEQKGIRKALNIASQIAPFAGLAIKQTPVGRIGGAALTGGSRVVEGLTRGETIPKALLQGAKAGGVDLITGGLGTALGKGIQAARKPIAKGMSEISGAPAESLEYLIENPDLVKGTNMEKIVLGARKSLIKKKDEARKLRKEQEIIADRASNAIELSDAKFVKNTVIGDTLKELNKMRGNTAKYSEQTKDEIRGVINLIKNDPSPSGRLEVLKKIDTHLRKSGAFSGKYDELKAKNLNDTDKLLLDVANKLRGEVRAINKYKVGEIRDAMSKILNATEPLESRLRKGKRAEGLFRTSKEQPIGLQDELKAFSDILPPQEQFYKKGVALAGTEKVLPKLPQLLMTAAPSAYLAGIIPTLAVAGTQSPYLQRLLIQSSPFIGKAAKPTLAKIYTPIERNPDGSITNTSQNKIKGER